MFPLHHAVAAGVIDLGQPLLAFLNAYFDESGKSKDHSIVSLCDWLADSREEIDRFARIWRRLLRQIGIEVLTMKEALNPKFPLSAKTPALGIEKRTEALMPFIDCIAKYADTIFVSAIEVAGFKEMAAVSRRMWGGNPHYAAFLRMSLELIHTVNQTDFIALLCDDDEETSQRVLRSYRKLRIASPEAKRKLVSITFADDAAYAPLQAADMIAALGRREAGRVFFNQHYDWISLYERFNETVPAKGCLGFWGKDSWRDYGREF